MISRRPMTRYHSLEGTMLTKKFLRETAERAVKSAAQAVVLVLGAGQVNALTVDWASVGGFSAGAAVISVCTSLLSAKVGPSDSASVV